MTRISKLFQEKEKDIFSVYFSSGYPTVDSAPRIIKALSDAGVDMIEIGIPFSDPLADGPVIQRSNSIALKNGISQKLLFEQIKDIRKVTDIPLIFMGYINCALQYGFENLCKKAVEIGIDGIILPDLPVDEYNAEYRPIVEKYGLDFIHLITPETSDERIRQIDEASTGFVYMVSSAGTTGAQSSFAQSKQDYFKRIKAMNLKNPTLVGFGVSNQETFRAAADNSRGAIVGSQFIKELDANPTIEDAVSSLIKKIKG